MITSEERVLKIKKSFERLSQELFMPKFQYQNYQIMMSSVARVKFIKTKVIFRYHNKGVSNQVSSN